MAEETILPRSVLTKSQKRQFGPRTVTVGRETFTITATVRHDDECGNGHNTFAITGAIPDQGTYGCIHEEIARHFPELAPLIKWHLVSTDGPMHYVANTIYHASDRDHRGLLKGEKRQLRNGRTGQPVWEPVTRNGKGEVVRTGGGGCWVEAAEMPAEPLTAAWEPVWITGEGKARDFKAARACAVWPEATDEELSLPEPELRKLLITRLPALMAEFKAAVESLGFTY